MSSKLDGSDKKVVLDYAIDDPESLAVDWIGRNFLSQT